MSDSPLPVPAAAAQSGAGATEAHVEYVVESRHHGDVERWLVVRPCDEVAVRFEALGLAASSACRVVVEEVSLRPVGILADKVPPAPSCAGYNPYFDVPPA
jgi:hypothetical protein